MITPRSIVVSAAVRLARYQAGYSVAEAARLAGVSPETLRRLESGTSSVRRETVARVLTALEAETPEDVAATA